MASDDLEALSIAADLADLDWYECGEDRQWKYHLLPLHRMGNRDPALCGTVEGPLNWELSDEDEGWRSRCKRCLRIWATTEVKIL